MLLLTLNSNLLEQRSEKKINVTILLEFMLYMYCRKLKQYLNIYSLHIFIELEISVNNCVLIKIMCI